MAVAGGGTLDRASVVIRLLPENVDNVDNGV